MSSTPLTDEQLLELFGKLRDGEITQAEFDTVQETLRRQPSALTLYQRYTMICSGLEQLSRIESTPTDTSGIDPTTSSLPDQLDVSQLNVQPAPRQTSQKPASGRYCPHWAWLVAASLVLGGGIAFLNFQGPNKPVAVNDPISTIPDPALPPDVPEEPPVSGTVLVEAIQASWKGSSPPAVGAALRGEYVLASGAARIRYSNGASLLIQAPAIFLITESNQLDLRTGAILADIPETAHGFRIDTPWGAVIDHGTQMGVLANDEEGVEVHGLQGLIELRKRFEDQGLMLRAGDAASLNIESDGLQKLASVPEFFAGQLDALADLPRVEGDVELRVSPPKAVRRLRSELVDVGRVTIFPERLGQAVDHVTRVTLAEPGAKPSFRSVGVNIPRNTRLDSYTMHFCTPRKERPKDTVLQAEGSVTFPRPIRGVRTFSPNQLAEEFGCPFTDYSLDAEVGLEDPDPADPDSGDWLELSEDRKTLRFRLRVHGRGSDQEPDFLDQFRILIDSAPESKDSK